MWNESFVQSPALRNSHDNRFILESLESEALIAETIDKYQHNNVANSICNVFHEIVSVSFYFIIYNV